LNTPQEHIALIASPEFEAKSDFAPTFEPFRNSTIEVGNGT
jgi:hypothetical protein